MSKHEIIDVPPWVHRGEIQRLFESIPWSHEKVRFVGGCVRNWLSHHPITDFDLATSYLPTEIRSFLQKSGIEFKETGISHGTITAVVHHHAFEITTLRKDIQTNGRHARVIFSESWEEDAARRDFTINALYLTVEGLLYDPWNGRQDLAQGAVRFIGEAYQRVQEDYLRILRYFRFYAHYGRSPADLEALEACQLHRHGLKQISTERISKEFIEILKAQNPLQAIDLMEQTKVSEVLFSCPFSPDFKMWVERERELKVPVDFCRRLYGLFGSAEKVFAQKLVLSSAERKKITQLESILKKDSRLQNPDFLLSPQFKSLANHLKYYEGTEMYLTLLILSPLPLEFVAQEILATKGWLRPVCPVKGEDLRGVGLTPGPSFGKALSQIERWWVDQDFVPDKQKCLDYLSSLRTETAV